MHAAKSHEAVKNSAETSSSPAMKSGGESAAPQPDINPLWHYMALNVAGFTALGDAGKPGIPTAGIGMIPIGLQPKLSIGTPSDRYEMEADRIADQIMRMPAPAIQPQPT